MPASPPTARSPAGWTRSPPNARRAPTRRLKGSYSINTVLNAALRCVRVSHYDTQRIFFRLAAEIGPLYNEAATMEYDDMNAFVPQTDILASLHEKGSKRLFMN